MQSQAITELLAMLPDEIHTFTGSQYPLPIKAALLDEQALDLAALRQELLQKQDGDVKDLLEPLLLAAEQVEAAQPDNARFFMTDQAVQGYVFSGSKWRAGWALVLGEDQGDLIAPLKAQSYMVFTDQPGIADTIYIGSRPTAPIYFLQLMARYGLVWGNIAPGDGHELGHFLEKDMPGLMIIRRDLPPLKYLVALGLMKLGAPAVVPSTFPFPYGNRIVADTIPQILERGATFPNLRQRYYRDEVIALPEYANVAYAQEKFEAARTLGATPNSFFVLWQSERPGPRLTITGAPDKEMGIQVDVLAPEMTPDIEEVIERAAIRAINYLPGVRAYMDSGMFRVELAAGVEFDSERIGGAIYWGIRAQYPRLEQIGVHLLHDSTELEDRATEAHAYQTERRQTIRQMTEANTEEFCACIECRPFSLAHTCLLTPEREPMCGARSYAGAKAWALYGSNAIPWKRQSEADLPLRTIFLKGEALDAERGEYTGVNQIVAELTRGQIKRVYLHSLRNHPHTSCGCFNFLAFWVEELGGIGILTRNSPARTPTGESWATLANRAGGKQSPGITGVSLAYIRSPQFLRGDGGLGNVVWVDSALYGKLADRFQPGQKVATEKDASTVAELKHFVGRDGPHDSAYMTRG